MRVLLVNDVGISAGGAETMILLLKSSLVSQGHTVKILAGNEMIGEESFSDFTYRTFADSSPLRVLFYIYNPLAVMGVIKALKSFKPDIVHLHNVKKASASTLLLLKKYPTVMTAHDLMSVDQTAFDKITALHPYKSSMSNYFIYSKSAAYWVQKFRFGLLKYSQKNIDLMIAPSKAMQIILNQSGLPARIKVVYNGIIRPINQFTQPANKTRSPTLLFIGRVIENKGILLLIEAFAVALKILPELKLIVVGNGQALSKAKKIVAKYRIEDAVRFTGHVKNSETKNYYAQSDVVVIPSISFDNLPTVAIEAMMLGKPLLVSNSGGLPELVDNNTGIVMAETNVKTLAENILLILTDKKKLDSMSVQSIKKSVEFTSTNYIKQTLLAYSDVIKRYSS